MLPNLVPHRPSGLDHRPDDACLLDRPSAVDVVVLDGEGRVSKRRELRVVLRSSEATIGDLAAAVGLPIDRGLLVDGHPFSATAPLDTTTLRRGATIAPSAAEDTAGVEAVGPTPAVGRSPFSAGTPVILLRSVRGPDAGREVALPQGRFVIGSASDVDVHLDDGTVSRRHAWLDVDADGHAVLTDLAPQRPSRGRGGEAIGASAVLGREAVLELGATLLVLAPAAAEVPSTVGDLPPAVGQVPPTARQAQPAVGTDHAALHAPEPGRWTHPVHRPPLASAPSEISPVPLPRADEVSPDPRSVGLAALVTTVVTGIAAALLLRQPAFLVFAVLGAAGGAGAAAWQGLRRGSRRRRARRARAAALERFGAELTAHQDAAAARLRRDILDLPAAVALLRLARRRPSRSGAHGLWGRGTVATGAFEVTVGRGNRLLQPVVTTDRAPGAVDVTRHGRAPGSVPPRRRRLRLPFRGRPAARRPERRGSDRPGDVSVVSVSVVSVPVAAPGPAASTDVAADRFGQPAAPAAPAARAGSTDVAADRFGRSAAPAARAACAASTDVAGDRFGRPSAPAGPAARTAPSAPAAPAARTAPVTRAAVATAGPAVARIDALDEDVWALVEAVSLVRDVPITVDLGPGQVVGVVGDAHVARALLRAWVLQLVVALGPADVLVAALVDRVEAGWMRWLPHALDPASGVALVVGHGEDERPTGAAELAERLEGILQRRVSGSPGRVILLVDDPAPLRVRGAPLRRLLDQTDGAVTPLVLAASAADLPSICTTVVDVNSEARAAITRAGAAELAGRVWLAGASRATATEAALALAGWHDPEQTAAAVGPEAVELAHLLGLNPLDRLTPRDVQARWRSAGDDPPPRASIAMAAGGPVEIDLERDGPHALIAGTTGSGKSELLRALVVALAFGAGPEHLSLILVDYKGGSAFDACAALPHVVGLVTDLDERLAERALRSLHAELRRRERLLRQHGCSDLHDYRAVGGREPLPRLVVVVDEFATLAADLPDFLASLVSVAQRGRSLGVHLVLATQRPAGAVSDDIRANTNLRIALRVLDPAESVDVVGTREAADLPRHRPGAALVRLGPEELVAAQIAAVSAPVAKDPGAPVSACDLAAAPAALPSANGRTALDVLVDAAVAAGRGRSAPITRPWLPALPDDLTAGLLPSGALGLVDDPDRQVQEPWSWGPAGGHLLACGALGSGVTTALAAAVRALAATRAPAELHVYVLDGGSALTSLARLPHVGATIGPAEEERQARLLWRLGRTLAQRSRPEHDVGRPLVLLVVDQLAAWRTAVAERLGPDLADLLDRLLVDGPALGIVVVGGLDRPGALPLGVCGAVGERLVFRLADAGDALAIGVRPAAVRHLPPGRAIVARTGLEIQVARTTAADAVPGTALAAPGSCPADGDGRPTPVDGRAAPVDALPRRVALDALPAVLPAPRPWSLPLGVGGDELEVVRLPLHPGDHVLVTGPARTGKSHALDLLARQVRRSCPTATIVGVAPRPSALRTCPALDAVATAPPSDGWTPAVAGPLVVLVDDAEVVDDADRVLTDLLMGTRDVHVLVAGRSEALRSAYGHWTQLVRRQRRGPLLRPRDDLDGELLGVALPRRAVVPPAPGRGHLVHDGTEVVVQLATTCSENAGAWPPAAAQDDTRAGRTGPPGDGEPDRARPGG